MELVEFYKLRWPFVRIAVVVLILAGLIIALIHHATVEVNGNVLHASRVLSAFAPIPMFIALGVAFWLGTSLSRERATLALSWVKPLPRWNLAARIIAVDVAFVTAMYAGAWLMLIGGLVWVRQPFAIDDALGTLLALSLGVAVMWYALTSAASSGLENGRIVSVFLLPASLVLLVLSNVTLPDPIGPIARLLNVLNPLAYLSSVQGSSTMTTTSAYWTYGVGERAAVVWLLSLAMLTVATLVWTRREA